MPRRIGKRADLVGIGERIRQLRSNELQEEFALLLGITQSQLSKIERGVLAPSVEVLIRLRELSGKTIDWMLTGKK